MKRYFGVLCIILTLLYGCGSINKQTDSQDISNISDAIGDENMDYVEMTNKEKELLSVVYSDADRIQQGKFFSHQEEALRQLCAGMKYLTETYPEHNFDI